MTLYYWIHWFWITFIFSRSILLVAKPYGLIFEEGTEAPLQNWNENQTNSAIVATVSTLKTDLSKIAMTSFNQSDVYFNNSNLLNMNRTFVTALPVNQTNVIDQSSNSLVENVVGNGTPFLNCNCSSCMKNSSFIIEHYNLSQSFIVNSTSTKMDQQQYTFTNSFSTAEITGITLGSLGIVMIIALVIFIVYRNIGFNRPQVLNDHYSNPDSSGYIDDSTMRENSEEMYSLDNDSFLNSLEAMTIQNLWTDTVKHTKL